MHGTTDSDLLSAVKGVDVSTILHKEPSTYVPNAHVLYYVLNQLDGLMAMNRYWSSKEVRWNTILSRIYFGILFYIQTLRSMRAAGIAPSKYKRILRDFEDEFDYSNLPIPGPLVPFFKALCISSPPYEEYGVITPCIPSNIGCTDATGHALADPLCYLLPNMAGMFNAYTHMSMADNNIARTWDRNFSDPAGAATPVNSRAANLQLQTASLSPGTVYAPTWNQRTRNTFALSANKITGIPSVALDAGTLDLESFLGISENPRWFGELTGLMTMYCQYWNGSTSLSACSSVNGPIAQTIIRGVDPYPDRTTHITTVEDDRIHYYSVAESARISDSPPAEAYALLTQINWIPPENFTLNDTGIGNVGVTRFGPWWNVAPIRSQSLRYSPTTGIPEILADKYYQDRPGRR
jgi:hypothetical protein